MKNLLVFVSVLISSLSFGQLHSFSSEPTLTITGQKYSTQAYRDSCKSNIVLSFGLDHNDTIQLGEYMAVFSEDASYAYKAILEIYRPNDEVILLTLPFWNLTNGKSYLEMVESFKEEDGVWYFEVPLYSGTFMQSEIFVSPYKEEENSKLVYQFTSSDRGENWVVTNRK
jgi:hypothetical protein